MAFVATQLLIPAQHVMGAAVPSFGSMLIDATGELAAFVGRVWTPNRGSKNIQTVGFRFGAVTKAGGSALTVSLQDVDLANGPPFRPDGTQDQTVAIANGNASFAAGTWIQTGNLSATRTVAHGDLLSVVVEYDGAGRLAADLVNIAALTFATGANNLESGATGFTSSTWAAPNAVVNGVILGFDDGSFGMLEIGVPASATSSTAFNNTSNPEIVGLQFQVPFTCKVDGAFALMQAAANADFSIVLYSVSGTTVTALATAATDANAQRAAATIYIHETIFAEQTLTANTTYFLGLKPTSANNVTLYDFSVSSAAHFGALWGGTTWVYNTVHGTTLGTATTTKRPFIGLLISAVDDGAGAGATFPASRAILGM